MKEIRREAHEKYQVFTKNDITSVTINDNKIFDTNYHYHNEDKRHPGEAWPPKTVLVVGDSMLNQLDEVRLSEATDTNVKVRSFGGVNVTTLKEEKIIPLLHKKPEAVILHVGTNDATYKPSDNILNELLQLKHFIEDQLKGCKVIFSLPIIRTDNSKAMLTIKRLNERMKSLKVNYCLNMNIDESCLGKKGHHMNPRGVGRLAVNLHSLIRKL